MSNERRSARNDARTEFSYGTNENQYTGIYLNHEYLDDISIMVSPNNSERNGETINGNTGVVNTLGQLNQPQQNSATTPRPLIHTDGSNETPLSLNIECDEPVVQSHYRNNTTCRPFSVDNVVNIPNIRNKGPSNHCNRNRYFYQPYLPTSLQHLMPAEQSESGPFSPCRIVNSSPSTTTVFRPPHRHQCKNNNALRVQEYPSSPPYRCESVNCQLTENKFETSNASKRDPRLINRDGNTYMLDNFEGLAPIRYNNKETYLDEDLRIINMKLKNMNSSNRFGVVNDLRSAEDFSMHNIRSCRDPRNKNNQNDRESETYIDRNKHLNILNTDQYKILNVGKMIGELEVRSDDMDIVNDTETTSISNVIEQYHKKKKKVLRKSREDDQKKLADTVENITFNLDDDISDLRCTTRTLSKNNDGIINTHDFNDQTKNNIKKANENILTLENSNVDNTQQNIDNIFEQIDKITSQNHKQLSGRSIELVDLSYEENTADVRTNQNVDTGMFTSKSKDMVLMSTVNENKLENIDKSSENSEKLYTNKNETDAENIILNEDRSVVDQRKTSEKKSHKHKSKKRNKSKDNNKHCEMYKDGNSSKTDSGDITIDSAFENTNSEPAINGGQTSDEQTNNAEMWTKLFKQQKKTDKNELSSEPGGNETPSNIKKKFMKNTYEIIENIQNEIISLVESINSETYVGGQSNPNTSTESPSSVTDVGEKTHDTHEQISIRVQDPKETSASNFPNKNHRSSIDFEKLVPGGRGTNEDSLKSNTVQSSPNPEQDESDKDVEEPIIECHSENMSYRNYAASHFDCESNEASFENVDDEQSLSYYTEYQSTGTNETNIKYESHEDASQSQTVDCMFDNSPSIDRGYNSALDVEKEVPPYIKLSEQILNENSISCDGNDLNYDVRLIKMERSEAPNYEETFNIDMEGTDTYETGYRTETFEDDTQSPRYSFIDDERPDVHQVGYGVDKEEPVDSYIDSIFEENFETRDATELNNEGMDIERNEPSVECKDTEIYEIIEDVERNEPSVECEDTEIYEIIESPADEPASDEQPTDLQPVGEHFEMDYFYNIIKINHSLFRVNLHTEDDIFNFIQLYSQRTQTSWRVLESFITQKYDVCKIFGCLHNGLFKLLKKPDKKIKTNKCECPSEIDIKIKCLTVRGQNSDPYLKNGLPAIVRFKNDHNHLVPKVTELPLLKSITDNNITISFDKGFEPAKIRQAYNTGISPNSNPPVVDITHFSDDDVEIVEITDLVATDQITENNLFGNWKDANIQSDIVDTKNNRRLKPGQQVVNNGERANDDGTSHQLVDTSYRKDYRRKLKGMISDRVKAKWLRDKMTTEADQVSLYKCSGKKCNEVFSRRKTFVPHLNDHCRNAKSQKKTLQFMICMYCFKSFDLLNIDALANHIFDNYRFCKYFCQYCLYRAYTASHVLVHEYIIHGEKKPSILKLKDRKVHDNSKEIVKVVDFNEFVLRYVCNIGNCAFYSYMDSDFLYHLSHDHVECEKFYCDICDKSNEAFVTRSPIAFVKHFSEHSMFTYQCIFCLFGAELLNLMIIHLAMEHFEYEPLCLERTPINMSCDYKKIENLIILNIKKSIPAGIMKVVDAKSLKDLNKKKCQTDSADTICTNTKSVNIDNTTQVSKRSIKEVVCPLKSTLKLAIEIKNNTIISDGMKRNVQRDEQQISNVAASDVNEKKKSSQLSVYEIMNNSELKKNFGKPFKEKGLKTSSSDDRIDSSKKHANKRLDNTCKNNEIRQTLSGKTSTNTKTVDIENTTQLLRRSTRKVVPPSKYTIKLEIDNKNNTVISDEVKRKVPRHDKKRIANSEASIENDKNNSSQLAIDDIRKNNATKPEIDNKNNTVISGEVKRKVPRHDKKRIANSEASIENDKNNSSQLAIDDIKNNIKSKKASKRNRNRETSIEKEKKELSQLAIHDIRKNNATKPEIDNKNNTVISGEVKRKVPRDDKKRIANSEASIENDKNNSSQLAIDDIKNNIKSKKASKRNRNRETSIEKEKKELSQLAIHDIRKNNATKPEIDNKNNTVISGEVKRKVPRDDAKRTANSEATIENDKKKPSQLETHDIRKNNATKPEIDNKNNTVISDEVKRNVPRDSSKRNRNRETSIEKEKKKPSQLAIHDIRKNNTTKPEIDNKNNTVISDEVKRNVPRDSSKRNRNRETSIEKEKKKPSQLAIHDIRKNNATKPEIDNKNNTVISGEVKRKVPRDDAKRTANSEATIENDKKKPSQLAIHDIRKNNATKPEIDNKNNTVISDEVKRNVPRDSSKRNRNRETSIEKEKKKPSQLVIHDIRKNNTTKPEIDNKNNTVISDEVKRNVPRDSSKRNRNRETSIEKEKKKPSQLAIHDIKNNIKSKKAIRKPDKEKSLETTSSDEPTEQCKLISKKSNDKAIPVGISYRDHFNRCPTESSMECTFCLAQLESPFDVVKVPRLPVPNRFTCSFCNSELPSSDMAKSHVKDVHNISNVDFVPVDINETDIEKDRFLVCEDRCSKRLKRANSSFYMEIRKTIANKKRSRVVSKEDDLRLTTIGNTTSTSKQQVERKPDESQQQPNKSTKRKHSIESTNNVAAVNYKKTPCWKRLYDTPGVKIFSFFSPLTIDSIPLTPYFSNPVGCIMCDYHTKVRSNLVSHLNRHGVEPVVLNRHMMSKTLLNKLKPAATASEPVNNSLCSSSKAKQNEKVQTVENSIDELTIKPPPFKPVNHIPKFVPEPKRFRCAIPSCYSSFDDFGNLQQHITRNHSTYLYFVCPHCRPLIFTFNSCHALEHHYNFHGSNLYICQYCDYIHYDRLKIESHQTRKHPLRMEGENNLNVVAIRKSNHPVIEIDTGPRKWQCNMCIPGIKYTETQIATHLSIVHKTEKTFICPICKFEAYIYDVFERHFEMRHPHQRVKNANENFEKISPDVELEPANKRTNVGKRGKTRESHSLNVPEAFNGAAEPRTALPSPRETPRKSTSARKTSAESLGVSEDQQKTLDNPSSESDDYSKLKCSTAKYECPICNEFAVEEKESFREHLLKEINCTLWKCLTCSAISNSELKMKIHVLKHGQLKRKFEKTEITNKNTLVDGIIDYQNKKLLKKNNQHTDCDDQNGAKHGNVQ